MIWSNLPKLIKTKLKWLFLVRIMGYDPKIEKFKDFQVEAFTYFDLLEIFSEIFFYGSYDFKADNDSPMIIDCGSNIGLSILFFKWRYPKAKIIGFEPDLETFKMLEKNIKANNLKDVTLHNCAVDDYEGETSLFCRADQPGWRGQGITKVIQEPQGMTDEKKVKVKRLVPFIDREIDLLKMDIEGSEYAVLDDLKKSGKMPLIKELIYEKHVPYPPWYWIERIKRRDIS